MPVPRELGRRSEFLDAQLARLNEMIVALVTARASGLLRLYRAGDRVLADADGLDAGGPQAVGRELARLIFGGAEAGTAIAAPLGALIGPARQQPGPAGPVWLHGGTPGG